MLIFNTICELVNADNLVYIRLLDSVEYTVIGHTANQLICTKRGKHENLYVGANFVVSFRVVVNRKLTEYAHTKR